MNLRIIKPRTITKPLSILLLVTFLAFIGCACGNKQADEPCAWCNHSPSVEYTTTNGTACYVCEECSSECMICGNKATKHFTNLLDVEFFVCDDCYAEAKDESQ